MRLLPKNRLAEAKRCEKPRAYLGVLPSEELNNLRLLEHNSHQSFDTLSEPHSQSETGHSGYALRVPVRPLGKYSINLASAQPIICDAIEVSLRSKPPLLILEAKYFPTQASALAFLPRAIVGFWSLTVRWNIAFRGDFALGRVVMAEDPVRAGQNIARSFGVDHSTPVDGLASEDEVVVLPAGKRIRFLGVGEVSVSVSTPPSLAFPTLQSALSNGSAASLTEDIALRTAMDLYNGHFYESSIQARLFTLVMILEVLAPPVTGRHPIVQDLIGRWKDDLRSVRAQLSDPKAREALRSLDQELEFKRETSIGRRLRSLVREAFQHLGEKERADLERSAASAYRVRSVLAHTGKLAPAELELAHEQASRVVRNLLAIKLGVALG